MVEEPTLVDDEPDEVEVCPVVDVGREVTVDDGPVVDVVGTVVVGRVVVVGGPLVTATGREASDGGPDWSPNWAITRTSNSTSIGTATSTVVTEPSKSQLLFGPGGAGTFNWPGAYGTWWQADPANDLILIYLIQNYPDLTSAAAAVAGNTALARLQSAQPKFVRRTYAALDL